MKNNSLWRVIWIVGIYAVLVSILYLVIIYKVKWENKDLNKYLYFYNCSGQICTSDISQNNFYSKIVCEDNKCPYIENINDDLLILSNENKTYLYNYLTGKIISDKYLEYKSLNNNYYIVRNNDNQEGIIDQEANIVIDFQDNVIADYNGYYLTYINSNNKYQIKNINTGEIFNKEYDEVILLNDKLYGYVENGIYYIAAYDSSMPVNNNTYEYIVSFDGIIFTIDNKKIDILNSDLKSTLIMTIPTYYEYKVEKERASLNLFIKDDILFFEVVNSDNSYINYKYDIKNKKLYS